MRISGGSRGRRLSALTTLETMTTLVGDTTIKEEDEAIQASLKRRGALPKHIAIIMDGNGRWARHHGKHRVAGHRQGTESVRDVTEACAEIGIEFLTLYTFSTENWQRPSMEVNALMELLVFTLKKETRTLLENDIRLVAIGDTTRLPSACRRELEETIEATQNNKRMTLNLALSYSGRWEILKAVREISSAVRKGELSVEEIDEARFDRYLETCDMPDPDLLIRTGGEYRISNFLLWQLAYTELHITECFWPDFRRANLYDAIRDFQDRDRRFGRVKGS